MALKCGRKSLHRAQSLRLETTAKVVHLFFYILCIAGLSAHRKCAIFHIRSRVKFSWKYQNHWVRGRERERKSMSSYSYVRNLIVANHQLPGQIFHSSSPIHTAHPEVIGAHLLFKWRPSPLMDRKADNGPKNEANGFLVSALIGVSCMAWGMAK